MTIDIGPFFVASSVSDNIGRTGRKLAAGYIPSREAEENDQGCCEAHSYLVFLGTVLHRL